MVSASYEEEWKEKIEAIATHLGAEHRFLDFTEGAIFDDSHPGMLMQSRRRAGALFIDGG